MTAVDRTAPAQSESLAFEIELRHAPEKVWRAITDPALLSEWLLPTIDFRLAPGDRAVGLQGKPEEELGRRAVWLEDDGRQTH